MAIDLKDFKKTKYKGVYKSINKYPLKGYKYLIRYKFQGKIYKRIVGYSIKDNLSDKTVSLILYKDIERLEQDVNPNEKITLDQLKEQYFKTLSDTEWKITKESFYQRYIKSKLGKTQIKKLKEFHITQLIKELEKRGLKPRTIRTVIEILKPMLDFAVRNKMILSSPSQFIYVKVPSQKKIVTNATEKFKHIFEGINTYYQNNPFYRALFLFGFTGRRKSEILNLKWENIDLIKNYYWIEDTKNSEKQKYPLPEFIKKPLLEIPDNKTGLVFKSPKTGKKIVNIDRQMNQLKNYLDMPELTLHYMRNIIVSSLAEQGTEAVYLSGILGHKDINTINKYLSNNHYKSGEIGLNKIDDILDVEVE